MEVIISCYIGCEDEVTTLNENAEDHDVDIFNIQKVQDTVIHLEVDEEQWEITQESILFDVAMEHRQWSLFPWSPERQTNRLLICNSSTR